MGVRNSEYGVSLPLSSFAFPFLARPLPFPFLRYSYETLTLTLCTQVNDAHDTTIDFAASFLEYWLLPLLTDPRVIDDETLILLTFDETETYAIQTNVFAAALGAYLSSSRPSFPLLPVFPSLLPSYPHSSSIPTSCPHSPSTRRC